MRLQEGCDGRDEVLNTTITTVRSERELGVSEGYDRTIGSSTAESRGECDTVVECETEGLTDELTALIAEEVVLEIITKGKEGTTCRVRRGIAIRAGHTTG